MVWRIHFTSNNVEYSSSSSVVERVDQVEIWRAANVSIREVTPGHRWLIVLVEHEAKPVIWGAISGDWTLGIEEAAHIVGDSTPWLFHSNKSNLPLQHKVEKRLEQPIQMTKYLKCKVKLYDPPHAAATEYRHIKTKRISGGGEPTGSKIGSPMRVAPEAKAKAGAGDHLTIAMPEASVAKRRTSVPTDREEDMLDARPHIHTLHVAPLDHQAHQHPKHVGMQINSDSYTLTGSASKYRRTGNENDSSSLHGEKRVERETTDSSLHSEHSRQQARVAGATSAQLITEQRVHTANATCMNVTAIHSSSILDVIDQLPVNSITSLCGSGAIPLGPSNAATLPSLATDVLLAERRTRYNRLLAQRQVVDEELRDLREREEQLTSRLLGNSSLLHSVGFRLQFRLAMDRR
ncbi:hypothetical protein C8Q73DRAFT_668872 [Cubamyces lactineus]|nr:hypothetical protein C8Q73DRAFT_668872 [Cubamyces lactineus]